jgi:lipoate-protein ligase A
MAVDSALLDSVKRGGPPVLRLYTWSPGCISFGRNQTAAGLFDSAAAAARGIDLVRRPTGGLAVLHDREITYAVVAPVHALGGPRETYRQIHRALVVALQSLGIDARLAVGGAAQPPTAGPCFRVPAPGEVIARGRKLVGSAQRREAAALLQHGSILLDGEQSLVAALQGSTPEDGDGAITVRDLLGRVPAPDAVAAAIRRGFEAACGIRLALDRLSRAERDGARRLVPHYASSAWTWRR